LPSVTIEQDASDTAISAKQGRHRDQQNPARSRWITGVAME
jgi:hypothetical protein